MPKTIQNADGTTRTVNLDSWKRQAPDGRDKLYAIKLHGNLLGRPAIVDLRSICSAVEDQQDIGSCTANMVAGMVESLELKPLPAAPLPLQATLPKVAVSKVAVSTTGVISFTTSVTPAAPPPSPQPTPTFTNVSRLFEYYATRTLEGTPNDDSGATIRDAIKAAATYGLVDETVWPYVTSKFAVRPPQTVWDTAATRKITSYHAIADGDLETIKSAVAAGFLVGFGFDVYSSFLTQQMATQGKLCLPSPSEQLEGGHAVAIAGYDDTMMMPDGSMGAFLVRNSWGKSWGLGGYYWHAQNYVGNTQLCNDFWVVQTNPFNNKGEASV